MTYFVLKLLHVAAVVMFLGNTTTGVFWKADADRTRDPVIIAHVMRGIIRSDRWFTVPGVVGIVTAGILAAIVGDLPILGTGWIFWSIVLFSISGLAFMIRLAPLQRSLAGLADEAARAGTPLDWPLYERLSRQWAIWGAIALVTPLIALALMVLKPALPAP